MPLPPPPARRPQRFTPPDPPPVEDAVLVELAARSLEPGDVIVRALGWHQVDRVEVGTGVLVGMLRIWTPSFPLVPWAVWPHHPVVTALPPGDDRLAA